VRPKRPLPKPRRAMELLDCRDCVTTWARWVGEKRDPPGWQHIAGHMFCRKCSKRAVGAK